LSDCRLPSPFFLVRLQPPLEIRGPTELRGKRGAKRAKLGHYSTLVITP
jgi:hypothetical protein